MVEILITLFILSVGLLGVASLQFVGTFTNAGAMQRANAVLVAQQLGERVQINSIRSATSPGQIADNQYFAADNFNFVGLECAGGNAFDCYCLARPAGIPDCQAGNCSSTEMARYDGWQISCAAVQADPNANINLSCNDINVADGDVCSAGSVHQIRIRWPATQWRGMNTPLNPACDPDGNDVWDCVLMDLVL